MSKSFLHQWPANEYEYIESVMEDFVSGSDKVCIGYGVAVADRTGILMSSLKNVQLWMNAKAPWQQPRWLCELIGSCLRRDVTNRNAIVRIHRSLKCGVNAARFCLWVPTADFTSCSH